MIDAAQIRERTDLVALIGETVRLKKQGAQFYGLCPFHQDRSPTLRVDPKKRLWMCPSCQIGGDCFTWLKHNGMGFREAAADLAKLAGIDPSVPKDAIAAPKAPKFPKAAVEPVTPWGGQHLLASDNRPIHLLNEFPGRTAYMRLVETVWPDEDVIWWPRRAIAAAEMYLPPIALRPLYIETGSLADDARALALMQAIEVWRDRYLAGSRASSAAAKRDMHNDTHNPGPISGNTPRPAEEVKEPAGDTPRGDGGARNETARDAAA